MTTTKKAASMPTNVTDRTRLVALLGDDLMDIEAGPGCTSLPLEAASPIRAFSAWQGKRNYEGKHWSSTVRGHVPYESLLERDYLLLADHDQAIVAMSAQPFALLWPLGTVDSKGAQMRWHVPDFFVRLSNGNGRVIDVRQAGHLAADQFAMTEAVCAQIGWDYQVFSGLEPVSGANLKWLGGYRASRCAPSDELRARILDVYGTARPLDWGISVATRDVDAPREVVHSAVLHMIFHGDLAADLSTPLGMDSEIVASRVMVLA